MKNEIISRLKAAGTLVQQGKLYQRATTGWRIIFKDLQWSSERMQSHKHCTKYHSNNPTHPLSAAIESPRWPPRKSHSQKKQNGRSYSWFWWLHIEKKKKSKKQASESEFSRKRLALFNHSRIIMPRLFRVIKYKPWPWSDSGWIFAFTYMLAAQISTSCAFSLSQRS